MWNQSYKEVGHSYDYGIKQMTKKIIPTDKRLYYAAVDDGVILAGSKTDPEEMTVSWIDMNSAEKKGDLYEEVALILGITIEEVKIILKALSKEEDIWD